MTPTNKEEWVEEWKTQFGRCEHSYGRCDCKKEIAFIKSLLKADRETLIQKVEDEKYDEDLEDIGAEVIAAHAYKDQFEAFRFGYNNALDQTISLIKGE